MHKKNNELVNKTSSFWKFLDDLAATDPATYADFMYKHKKSQPKMINNASNYNVNNAPLFGEFDKCYFTPIPFMVIKTKISETKNIVETLLNVNDYRNTMKKGQKLYVNLLESPYCKPLQSKSNSKISQKTPISDILIPIQVSKLINEDRDDKCWRSDVVYHNSVYQHFNNNNNNYNNNKCQFFKKWIIEFALRQIEAQNSLKLLRDYKILKTKKFIGKTPPNPHFCQHKFKNQNTINIEKKCEGKIVAKRKSENDKNNENILDDDKKMDIVENKSYLIPKYTLNTDTAKNIINIVIEMEKDNTIKDIELDMNDSKLSLTSLHYKLNLVFPSKVNDNDIKAKFDTKKHCLKLKLYII